MRTAGLPIDLFTVDLAIRYRGRGSPGALETGKLEPFQKAISENILLISGY